MTAHERLNARPAAIHPSQRRVSARNPEVCSNPDNDRNQTRPKMQNRSTFSHGAGVRTPQTVAPRPCSTIQVIWRPLKSHR